MSAGISTVGGPRPAPGGAWGAGGAGLPVLACALGIALFAYMDAVMKGLSLALGVYCAMLWRTVFGIATTGLPFALAGARWPGPAARGLHLQRGAVNAVSATGYFFGLARLPMAEGIALSFIAPLVALYLSAAMLGERVPARAILASLVGLAGVGVIVSARIGGAHHDAGALAGALAILVAAAVYGYGIVLLRQQARSASPIEVAFFQNAATLLWLLPAAWWLAPLPPARWWPGLALGALLAQSSMTLLAWAYARAPASRLIPLEYSAFVWSALFGALVFGERVTPATLAGAVLIVGGCALAALAGRPEPLAAEVSL